MLNNTLEAQKMCAEIYTAFGLKVTVVKSDELTDGQIKWDWTQYKVTYFTISIFVNVILSFSVMLLTCKYRRRDEDERKMEKLKEKRKERNVLVNEILKIYFKLITRPISRVENVVRQKQESIQTDNKTVVKTEDQQATGSSCIFKDAYGILYQDIENYAKLLMKREEKTFHNIAYTEETMGTKQSKTLYSLEYIHDICEDVDDITQLLTNISGGILNETFKIDDKFHIPTEFEQIRLEKFIQRLQLFLLNYYDRVYGKVDIKNKLFETKSVELSRDTSDDFASFAYLVFQAEAFLSDGTKINPQTIKYFKRIYNGIGKEEPHASSPETSYDSGNRTKAHGSNFKRFRKQDKLAENEEKRALNKSNDETTPV